MRFLFVYRCANVPQDKMEENGKAWFAWLQVLKEKAGIRTAGGKTVTAHGVQDFKRREFGGASIVEFPSLEEAVKMAQTCPGLPYGEVDVLEEFKI